MTAAGPTRVARLVGRVRGAIASGKLVPGQRVTEAGLAAEFGTSRTPVREALRILTQEMLLEHSPNWGYRVSRLDIEDLDELYAVRVAIECQSVGRLAEGRGDLTTVESLLTTWDIDPATVSPHVDLVFADEQFHESLAAASGGTVLLPMLQLINRRLHSSRMREFIDAVRVQRTYAQHVEILRAIFAGAAPLATALMTAHVLEGKQYVRGALAGEHSPTTPSAAESRSAS